MSPTNQHPPLLVRVGAVGPPCHLASGRGLRRRGRVRAASSSRRTIRCEHVARRAGRLRRQPARRHGHLQRSGLPCSAGTPDRMGKEIGSAHSAELRSLVRQLRLATACEDQRVGSVKEKRASNTQPLVGIPKSRSRNR